MGGDWNIHLSLTVNRGDVTGGVFSKTAPPKRGGGVLRLFGDRRPKSSGWSRLVKMTNEAQGRVFAAQQKLLGDKATMRRVERGWGPAEWDVLGGTCLGLMIRVNSCGKEMGR